MSFRFSQKRRAWVLQLPHLVFRFFILGSVRELAQGWFTVKIVHTKEIFMKNIFAVAMFSVLALSLGAQDLKSNSTQFDQVLLQKGTLIHKEFVKFGSFNKIQGEIAVLTNVNSNDKTFALRMTTNYYRSQYDNGETSGVLDAKEVESALKALDYMIVKSKEITSNAPYTEVIYRGIGDPHFGFFASGSEKKGFFEISDKGYVSFEIAQLEQLKVFFASAKAKIIELGGKMN